MLLGKEKRDELNLSCVNQGNSYCWQTGLSPQAFKVHVLAAHDCLENTDKIHKLKKDKKTKTIRRVEIVNHDSEVELQDFLL